MTAKRHESFPPWDEQVDLSDILEGEAGDLLREHANIAPEKMEDHVKHVVSIAVRRFVPCCWCLSNRNKGQKGLGCFEEFLLHFDLARSPLYRTILKLIQAGHLFVDLGCGLGRGWSASRELGWIGSDTRIHRSRIRVVSRQGNCLARSSPKTFSRIRQRLIILRERRKSSTPVISCIYGPGVPSSMLPNAWSSYLHLNEEPSFSAFTSGVEQQEPGTLCPLASVRCFCTIRKHSLSFSNRPEQKPRLSGSFKLSSRMMNIARTLTQRDVGWDGLPFDSKHVYDIHVVDCLFSHGLCSFLLLFSPYKGPQNALDQT